MLLIILLTPSIFSFILLLLLHLYTFHRHTYIYFNFQFHKDIFLPCSHVLLHCSTVHSETAVLKGPILFLCTLLLAYYPAHRAAPTCVCLSHTQLYSSILTMEKVQYHEMSVRYQTIRCHVPKDSNPPP
jgi:hypothetical protein